MTDEIEYEYRLTDLLLVYAGDYDRIARWDTYWHLDSAVRNIDRFASESGINREQVVVERRPLRWEVVNNV